MYVPRSKHAFALSASFKACDCISKRKLMLMHLPVIFKNMQSSERRLADEQNHTKGSAQPVSKRFKLSFQ